MLFGDLASGDLAGAFSQVLSRRDRLSAGSEGDQRWSLAELGLEEADYAWLQGWAKQLTYYSVDDYLKRISYVGNHQRRHAFMAVLFLAICETARRWSFRQRGVWQAIVEHSGLGAGAKQRLFTEVHMRPDVRDLLHEAIDVLGLRHALDLPDVQQKYYLTITLQYGFSQNGFRAELSAWLRCTPPDAVEMLLGRTGAYRSRSFADMWEILKLATRNRITDAEVFRKRLLDNPWVPEGWIAELFAATRRAAAYTQISPETPVLDPPRWVWSPGRPLRALLSLQPICTSGQLMADETYEIAANGRRIARLVNREGVFVVDALDPADQVQDSPTSVALPLEPHLLIDVINLTSPQDPPFSTPFRVELWQPQGTITIVSLPQQIPYGPDDSLVPNQRYLIIGPKAAQAASAAIRQHVSGRFGFFLCDGLGPESVLCLNGRPFWQPTLADGSGSSIAQRYRSISCQVSESVLAGTDFRLRVGHHDSVHIAEVWSDDAVAWSEVRSRLDSTTYDATVDRWQSPGRVSLAVYLADGSGHLFAPVHSRLGDLQRSLRLEAVFRRTPHGDWRRLKEMSSMDVGDLHRGSYRFVTYREDVAWPSQAILYEGHRPIAKWENAVRGPGLPTAAIGQRLALRLAAGTGTSARLYPLIDGGEVCPFVAPFVDTEKHTIRVCCRDGSAVSPSSEHRIVLWSKNNGIIAVPVTENWRSEDESGCAISGWSAAIPPEVTGVWMAALAYRGKRLGASWARPCGDEGLFSITGDGTAAARAANWLRWFRFPILSFLHLEGTTRLFQDYAASILPALLSMETSLATDDGTCCYLPDDDQSWLGAVGDEIYADWQPKGFDHAGQLIDALCVSGDTDPVTTCFSRLLELSPALAANVIWAYCDGNLPGKQANQILCRTAEVLHIQGVTPSAIFDRASAMLTVFQRHSETVDPSGWAARAIEGVQRLAKHYV